MIRKIFSLLCVLAVAASAAAQTPTLIPYRKGDKWGYCTPDKKIVIPCEYDDAEDFCNGFARINKNHKWGFVNTDGRLVVSCIYEEVEGFSGEGLAVVKKTGKWGVIDKSGQLVMLYDYDYVQRFYEGLAAVNRGGYYDADSDTFIGGRWGLINTNGKLVVPCVYDEIKYFYQLLPKVTRNGKDFYISREGVEYYED